MKASTQTIDVILVWLVVVFLIGLVARLAPDPARGADVTSPAETPTPHADIGGVVRGPSHADRGDFYVLASEW